MTGLEARIEGVGFWASGLPSWESARGFASGGTAAEDAPRKPSPQLLAANERRRAPETVAVALEVALAACHAAGRDPDAIGLQGRIEVHGALDRDRFRRALDAWAGCDPTHLSIVATGQGDARAHIDLLPQIAALVSDHLDPTPRGAA